MKEPGNTSIQITNLPNNVTKMTKRTKDPVFVTNLDKSQNTRSKLKATPPIIE